MARFDLEERTLKFGKSIIVLCNLIPRNIVNNNLVDQLVRSGTSVGANYREANETDAKKDFANKIRIAKKEAKETMYWLDLLESNNNEHSMEIKRLWNECYELVKILSVIYQKSKV